MQLCFEDRENHTTPIPPPECIADILTYDRYGQNYNSLQCADGSETSKGSYETYQVLEKYRASYMVDATGVRTGPIVSDGRTHRADSE